MRNITQALSLFLLMLFGHEAQAITPTFHIVKEIDFGNVMFIPGSCQMVPTTGFITTFTGQYICINHEGSTNGEYIITANPHKNLRVRVPLNLDNGNGIKFNPKTKMISDSQVIVIYNTNEAQVIDTGDSGIVNLYLGGELTVTTNLSPSQEVSFSFPDAIEWSEDP